MWAAADTWGRQLVLLAAFVILARFLGPEELGIAALALVAPAILAVPVTLGIPEALIQRPRVEREHLDSAFWLLVVGGAALSALIWGFADVIAMAFGEPLLASLVRWTSIIVVIQAVGAVPAALLKRELDFRLLAFRTLLGTVGSAVVGIGMAIAGCGVWSLVTMQIVRPAIESIVLLMGCAWRPRPSYSHERCSELFGFAGPIIGQSFLSLVNVEMPKIALGTFLGADAVGLYALARRPLEFLTAVLLQPLSAVAMPAVSRVQGDPRKVSAFFDTAVRVAGLVGFPAFIGLVAIAPAAVPLVFGERWEGGIVAVQILSLIGVLRTIDSLCGLTVLALGHSLLILQMNLVYLVLGSILVTTAVQISLEATMVALVMCEVVILPIFLFCARRAARVEVMRPLAMLPRLAMTTALMFVAVTAWRLSVQQFASHLVVVACGIAIGASVYGGAAILFLRSDLLSARALLLKARDAEIGPPSRTDG